MAYDSVSNVTGVTNPRGYTERKAASRHAVSVTSDNGCLSKEGDPDGGSVAPRAAPLYKLARLAADKNAGNPVAAEVSGARSSSKPTDLRPSALSRPPTGSQATPPQ